MMFRVVYAVWEERVGSDTVIEVVCENDKLDYYVDNDKNGKLQVLYIDVYRGEVTHNCIIN